MKVAVIGAGSVGFTRKLVRDMLKVPELQDTEFALHDINAANLDMVAQILRRDVEANGLPARITTAAERRRALEGARYVISCVRIGGLRAFASDIEIPLRYGVDQCVGDTICAGGILYGQRNIPQVLEFCRDIRAEAEEGAWFLNYANPMAMNTWAAIEHGGVANTIGLCHGVQHGWHQIAEVLGAEDPREVDYVCAGINHQTWYIDIRFQGRKIEAGELLEAFERHPRFREEEKVRIDVLRRFGCYSTESNGHLSEYLPWYRKRPDEINRWIDLSRWINGETGGYLRECTEQRNWFETDFPRWLAEAGAPLAEYRRSDEHGSYIIEGLETGRVYRGHFNRRNEGLITNLPQDCIVETPGFVDRFGLNMVAGLELPLGCAATCSASINVQRMAVQAAVTGDLDLLRLAVLHDPLVGAVCNPEEVWQMVDELLVAQAEWLPQYADAVPAARERLARRRIPTRGSAGAARLSVRGVDELRAARARAKAAG
ncbi:alpha-glucosidase/alpha-galactosidase [Inquilinus sp.]|jgi:alpha-galactosidase|uniref:alpha-glucosidase/alpha-galactosidase n=1 Tax=Inquilinus sp. TaxID=1932117 RepID=UPI00378375D8